MVLPFYCKKLIMTASRKKKTVLYGVFAAAIVFAFVQVTYFNEAYSPLQVLSDARSEAKRLLKFITLYHYACNATIQGLNVSQWPVCVEKAGGLNLVLGGPRIMYSIGPTPDYPLERILALNFSYQVHVFHHEPLSPEFMHTTRNKTRLFKTTIVPNDPSDYGRNSYDTRTLNSVFETLKHPVVDILKIETIADRAHSHELLHYMVKDRILSKVRQLHLTLHIDKVDDDFLYSWYKALYTLFQNEGFRLYHSSASDSLCLQVTLMESCVYYTSWIRDPGPETFVLYPPAIDGSLGFEVDRLEDYLEGTEATCSSELEVKVHDHAHLTLCMDTTIINPSRPCQMVVLRSTVLQTAPVGAVCSTGDLHWQPLVTTSEDYLEGTEATCSSELEVKVHDHAHLTLCMDTTIINPSRPCQMVVLRSSADGDMTTTVPHSRCSVTTFILGPYNRDERRFYVQQHSPGSSDNKQVHLGDALQKFFQFSSENILYVDIPRSFWAVLDQVLNSGALFNVNQIILNIKDIFVGSQASEIRRRFSELQRVEAYGFRLFQIDTANTDNKLSFRSKHMSSSAPSSHKLNYLKSGSGWVG